MAHLTSFKRCGAIGVLRHDERKPGESHNRKNECIKPERTHLNYNLAQKRQGTLFEHIQQVCEENNVRLSNRKDLNVMSSWVVTLPADVKTTEQKKFFQETHNFLENRYGKSFTLSSTVHLDETTPHLHFNFIPVGKDKNGNKTVSSKLVCTRNDLKTFHKDLSKYLEKAFGRIVSIQNQATIEGNKSIAELKRESAKDIQQVKQELKRATQCLKGMQGVELDFNDIDMLTPQKTLTGHIKGINLEDIYNLKKTALVGLIYKAKFEKTFLELKKTKSLSISTQDKINIIKDKQRLEKLELAFQKLPQDVQNVLLSSKIKNRNYSGFER